MTIEKLTRQQRRWAERHPEKPEAWHFRFRLPGMDPDRELAFDLSRLGTLKLQLDRDRKQFYVTFPAPFEHVRLYHDTEPTFDEAIELQTALRHFGVDIHEHEKR